VDLTSDDVQDILQLLDGLPFGEMHLRTASFSLWLRRSADGEWTQELQVLAEPTMTPAASPAEAAGAPGTAEAPGPAGGAPDAPVPDGLRAVRTPLPGTFYRAPMPGAPPFVEVGSRVEPDTVVGIVETMKLMNSVCAGARGTVAEILLANAQFAERDTALMWIREDP
jgi:acetyl-CoA carboxylase biotin carboxyl carrier protein